jgi:sulfate transport system ATP-binding protein
MSITVERVSKRFGKTRVLEDVSVEAPSGQLVALLGPSGSGKTTLLRIIAGLETPDGGTVRYTDVDVTRRSARDRNVGFVFQHYALFRHMSVFENVAFGMRVRGWPSAKVAGRVKELLHLVRLEGLERRFPSELSGGQLRRFHEQLHVTSLFVTHDQEEAFEVADRVVIMNRGRIEQSGPPAEVFEHPANAFVMDFLGNVNVFHARLTNGQAHVVGGLALPYPDYTHEHPAETKVFVRPHELTIDRIANGDGTSLAVRVMHINPAGSVVKVRLLAEEFDLVVNVDLSPTRYAELVLKCGEHVYVSPQRLRVFMPDYAI